MTGQKGFYSVETSRSHRVARKTKTPILRFIALVCISFFGILGLSGVVIAEPQSTKAGCRSSYCPLKNKDLRCFFKKPMTAIQLQRNFHEKKFTGRTVDLEMKEVDLRHVLKKISLISGLRFRVDLKDYPIVSLSHKAIPWDKGLYQILEQNDLRLVCRDRVLRVLKK